MRKLLLTEIRYKDILYNKYPLLTVRKYSSANTYAVCSVCREKN